MQIEDKNYSIHYSNHFNQRNMNPSLNALPLSPHDRHPMLIITHIQQSIRLRSVQLIPALLIISNRLRLLRPYTLDLIRQRRQAEAEMLHTERPVQERSREHVETNVDEEDPKVSPDYVGRQHEL